MTRRTLPQRRPAETFDLLFRNQSVTVTIGFYPNGNVGETFVDVAKSGNDLAHIARDAAIVLSIALQCGASVETLRHALTRGSHGEPASIMGAIVDALPVLPRERQS
jgi:hypothetical protein